MNVSLLSKLFGNVALYDLVIEVLAMNTRPYATTIPLGPDRRGNKREPTPIPKMRGTPKIDRANDKYGIRAAQVKSANRRSMALEATALGTGMDRHMREFASEVAALQTFQGGFFAEAIRLNERDTLRRKNPVVYLHGAGTVGGQIRCSDLVTTTDVELTEVPIVRTDSTEQQLYTLSEEASKTHLRFKELHRERRPFTNALTRRPSVEIMEALIQELRDLGRNDDAEAAEQFMAIKGRGREGEGDQRAIRKWLEDKRKEYTTKMKREGVPIVEIRQALPGFKAIPAGTEFRGVIDAYGLTDWHAGLIVKTLYRREPVLGGRRGSGAGAYLRQVLRMSVSDTFNAPKFDCLIRIEPFKPLMFCIEDHQIDAIQWDNVPDMPWQPLVGGKTCLITTFLAAWDQVDRSKFDFNYVPAGARIIEEEEEEDA